MGSIVGAAIVAHVPPIVAAPEVLAEIYGPGGTTLVDGLHRLRAEQFDTRPIDTVVVVDSHWFTTVEHIITAHERRSGLFTSEELPRGMTQMPYDIPGDPELAKVFEELGTADARTRVLACADPELPIRYATTNLLPFLQGDEAWVSMSVCQTADPDDYLAAGEILAEAIAALDRRVVILGSGGLSHRFWPMREFAEHETADPAHIRTPEARAADEHVLDLLDAGDHAGVIDFYPEYRPFFPEGWFGHYLITAGACGGRDFRGRAQRYSAYESSAGTGQIHLWFDGPFAGPAGSGA